MSDATDNVFSRYIESRQNTGGGRSVGFQLSGAPASGMQSSGTNRGWLANFVDFLNIGVYPGTNLANEFLSLPERREEIQAKAAEGRTDEAIRDVFKVASGVATAVPRGLAAPFRRAFGAELPEGEGDTWERVFERTSDVVNRNNPNYVDTDHNLHPTAKAGWGLVADIVLDPLTWLAGGRALSVSGKVFSRGVGAVAGATTTVSKSAKAAETLVENANKFTLPKAAPESVSARIAESFDPSTVVRAEKIATPTSSAGKGVTTTSGADNFPASSVVENITKAVDDAPLGGKTVDDAVNEILAKTVDSKMIDLPGVGKTNLKGGLKSFFNFLKTPAVAAGPTGKIVENFGSFVNMLRKDVAETGGNVRIEQVLRSYQSQPIQGTNATIAPTIAGVMKQYDEVRKVDTPTARAIREAIETRILMPLQKGYNSATRAGHNVTAFGAPKTASAAVEMAESSSIAETVLRNLQTLDEGNRARGVALLGEDFFNAVAGMQTSQIAKVLDDLEVLLQATGTNRNISSLLQNDTGSEFLRLFDIDNAIYAAAKSDVADRFADAAQGVRKTNLEEALSKIDAEPAVLDDLAENLSFFGMTRGRYSFLSNQANAAKVFDAVLDALDAGADASKINFSDALRKESGFAFTTSAGAARTADIYGEGFGIVPNLFNSTGQMNYIVAMGVRMNKYFDRKTGLPFLRDLPGFAKISAKESMMLSAIKTFENAMEAKGVPILIDLRLARDTAHLTRNLKFSQVYETLTETARNAMRIATFKPGSGVSYTKMMDAVMTGITTGDRSEVLRVLRSTENLYKKETPNFFANPNAIATVGKTKYRSGDLSEEVADAIIANIAKFEDLADINARAYRARGLAEAEALSSTGAEIVLKLLADPTKVAQAGLTVAKSGRMMGDIANTVGDISPLGNVLGNMRLTLGLGENFKMSAETTVALAQQILKRDPRGIDRAREASYKQAEQVYETADKAAIKALDDVLAGRAKVPPGSEKLVDDVLGEVLDSAISPLKAITNGAYGRFHAAYLKAFNFLNRLFNVNRGLGVENNLYVAQMYKGVENIQGQLAREILVPIAMLGQKYKGFVDEARTTTIAQEAFNAIREGRKATGIAGEMQTELLPFFGKFFNLDGVAGNALMGNLLLRQGASLERVNEILSSRRVLETTSGKVAKTPDEYYDLGKVAEELGPNPKPEDVLNALSEQWKTWDIQDPINFLDKYTRAISQVIGEATYVTAFKAESLGMGLASTTPKAGFVRISQGDGPILNKHLQEDLWVDPDVAEAFTNLSTFIDEISVVGKSNLERYIDEFTDGFKYAATQARLGHHVRNYVGGLSLTGMAQGVKYFRKAGIESIRVTRLLRREIDEVDLARMMERLGEPGRTSVSNIPEAQRVLHNGAKGKITVGEMADAIQRMGIDPTVRTAEAFAALGKAEGLVGRWTQKFLTGASLGIAARGGRMERMWTNISMMQDHQNRNHLFIQYVMQALDGAAMPRGFGKKIKFDFNKPDVMEDIFTAAAERVLRYQPTGQSLTALERKVPRRLFPFYAWNKGAVIALSETVVMYPSRVSWPFKANYNLSVATGVDPNSYYDPFPTNQKFPSYMTEDIQGPQFLVNGRYYGFQPGLAQLDVLNQFGGSDYFRRPIEEAALNSLNPGLKLPIELITGSRMNTRNPIADISDHVDSSIPNVTYYANATTYSPTSIIIDGQWERQKKYESGDKTNLSRVFSALNWLTGFSFREYSRPDVVRLAEIEENQRRAEERERR